MSSGRAWRRFFRNRLATFSLVVLILIHLAALFAPVLARHDPNRVNLMKRLKPPSSEHWLGTDESGRDVYSRLVYGARVSLAVGLTSVAASISMGVVLGAAAGFAGGWVDGAIMRFTDGMLSIPLFFFAMTALALLGSSLPKLVAVIALVSWMPVARVVRGEVLKTRELPFVEAARAVGNRPLRVLFVHVLPQSYPSVIVAATLGVAYNILQESALSFLGLGVQPPTPSWGNMLTGARSYLFNQPVLTLYPGGMIFLTVLLYNWLGDGIRDAFDPAASGR